MMKKTNAARLPLRAAAAILALILCALLLLPAFAEGESTNAGAENGKRNIIYYEDFSENTEAGDALISALGWRVLSSKDGNAPTNNTMKLSVEDGRLLVNNRGGNDSYIEILNSEAMKDYGDGDYTLQYDLNLEFGGDTARYIVLLHDYTESTKGTYNSFHLRINGSGNNQARVGGGWTTYDDRNGEYFAEDKNDDDGTPTIAMRILGKKYTGGALLLGVDLTIRIHVAADAPGPEVWIRNNSAGGDFVLVSVPSQNGDAWPNWRSSEMSGRAIVLKSGGSVTGYIDNVLVYSGLGEPKFEDDPIVTEPETTVEETTPAAPEKKPFVWETLATGKYTGWAIIAVIAVCAGALAMTAKPKKDDKKGSK